MRVAHRFLLEPYEIRGDQGFQGVHLRPRQQCRDNLEGWIFGRRADQDDVAALDEWQECVLLSFVEAMDFVHEHDRSPSFAPQSLGLHEHRFDLLDAAQDTAERHELALSRPGDDARQRSLPNAWRPPKNHGSEFVGLDLPAEWLAGTDQMLLADEFFQSARTHAFRQRPTDIRPPVVVWFEEAHRIANLRLRS